MKKKMAGIGVALALTMSMGTAGLAFGASMPIDPTNKTGTTTVEQEIPIAYTITIPEKAEIGVESTISATGCVLPILQTLKVTASDLSAKSDNPLDTASYAITTNALNEEVLVLAQVDGATKTGKFTFSFQDPAPVAAAKYTATVTFAATLG